MGGFGSGVWSGFLENSKATTEELLSVDVRELKREGRIVPGQEKFTVTEGVVLSIAWTPCNFGGSRPWFVCPGEKCGRRAAILYLRGVRLLCRRCHDLAYQSQRESPLERARRRTEKARARLLLGAEQQSGEAGEPVAKPKGMHHSTFVRLGREYIKATEETRALYYELGEHLAKQNLSLLKQMVREENQRNPSSRRQQKTE